MTFHDPTQEKETSEIYSVPVELHFHQNRAEPVCVVCADGTVNVSCTGSIIRVARSLDRISKQRKKCRTVRKCNHSVAVDVSISPCLRVDVDDLA